VEPTRKRDLTWLWYTLARLGIFAVVLVLLLLVLPVEPWISAIIAAIIAFCVSYIFLNGQRDAVARRIADARAGNAPANVDDEAEDAALDGRSEGERGPEPDAVDESQDAGERQREDQLPRGAGGRGDEGRGDRDQ
jgi:hypothetical protein